MCQDVWHWRKGTVQQRDYLLYYTLKTKCAILDDLTVRHILSTLACRKGRSRSETCLHWSYGYADCCWGSRITLLEHTFGHCSCWRFPALLGRFAVLGDTGWSCSHPHRLWSPPGVFGVLWKWYDAIFPLLLVDSAWLSTSQQYKSIVPYGHI